VESPQEETAALMRRPLCQLFAVLALVAAPAGIAACGGDGGGDGQSSEEAAAEAAAEKQAQEAAREKRLAAKVRRLIPIARQSQTGKTRKEQLRIADAEGQLGVIAGQSLEAIRPLLQGLKERDYELIADLDVFYVALGKPGSQPILADAVAELYPGGDPDYAGLPFTFLGAGNARLEREVTGALESAGFTITGEPSFTGASWGSSGAYGPAPIAPGVPAPPTAPPP
jgi:hypothetical protein